MKQLLLLVVLIAFIFGCKPPEKKPVVKELKREAVNVQIKVDHMGEYDILTYNRTAYDNNGKLVLTKTSIDTLPALGFKADTLYTGRDYEDEDGNTNEIDTTIVHKKDYQVFIKIKE